MSVIWLDWIDGTAEEIAAALQMDWRERGALTPQEAFGEADDDTPIRKSAARAQRGGAMSRFASEATMRHLKTVGLVDGLRVRNVTEEGKPAQGVKRLWSVTDALKAEIVLSCADYADLPSRNVARLLKEIPVLIGTSSDTDRSLIDGYAEIWSGYAAATLGQESADPKTRREANALLDDAPEAADGANRSHDPKLLIVDRRWVFGVNLAAKRPGMNGFDAAPFPLAEIKAFRSGEYDAPFFIDAKEHVFAEEAPDYTRAEAPEVSDLWKSAAVTIELNLFEPMRRFIHRNRKRRESS